MNCNKFVVEQKLWEWAFWLTVKKQGNPTTCIPWNTFQMYNFIKCIKFGTSEGKDTVRNKFRNCELFFLFTLVLASDYHGLHNLFLMNKINFILDADVCRRYTDKLIYQKAIIINAKQLLASFLFRHLNVHGPSLRA